MLAHTASIALRGVALDDVDVREALPLVPSIASLRLVAAVDPEALPALPKLTELAVLARDAFSTTLSPAFLAALARTPMPALERLDLGFDRTSILADVEPLLARTDLTELRTLCLRWAPFIGVTKRLAGARLPRSSNGSSSSGSSPPATGRSWRTTSHGSRSSVTSRSPFSRRLACTLTFARCAVKHVETSRNKIEP